MTETRFVMDPLDSLMAYGLTLNQAKIYITMVKSKADTVKAIAKLSKIPVESVYRGMPALEELHLVERILTTPVKYKAIPPQQAIELLKARDKKERFALYSQTDYLIEELTNNTSVNQSQNLENDTVIIASYEALTRKLGLAINNMTQTFQGITNVKNYRFSLMHNSEFFENSLRRGVKCHHVIYLPSNEYSTSLGDNHLIKNGCWKRKFVSEIPVELAIIDKKELFMSLSNPLLGKKHRAVHTTNPCLLTLAMNYFDSLWTTAEQIRYVKAYLSNIKVASLRQNI